MYILHGALYQVLLLVPFKILLQVLDVNSLHSGCPSLTEGKPRAEVESGQLGLWAILFCRLVSNFFVFLIRELFLVRGFYIFCWVRNSLMRPSQCRESYMSHLQPGIWPKLFSSHPIFLHSSHCCFPQAEEEQVRVDTGLFPNNWFPWAFTPPDSTYILIVSYLPHRWGGISTLGL